MMSESVVDIAGEPVAFLRDRELLRLGGVYAQLLVRGSKPFPRALFAHQQLGEHGGEERRRERAESFTERVLPSHSDVYQRNDRRHHSGGRQRQQQHALRDQDHQQQRRPDRRAGKREQQETQRQLHTDVDHRDRSAPPANPPEPDGGDHRVHQPHEQRRDEVVRACGTDRQRRVRDDRQDAKGPVHGPTVLEPNTTVNQTTSHKLALTGFVAQPSMPTAHATAGIHASAVCQSGALGSNWNGDFRSPTRNDHTRPVSTTATGSRLVVDRVVWQTARWAGV
jgi:hypothetical protein